MVPMLHSVPSRHFISLAARLFGFRASGYRCNKVRAGELVGRRGRGKEEEVSGWKEGRKRGRERERDGEDHIQPFMDFSR